MDTKLGTKKHTDMEEAYKNTKKKTEKPVERGTKTQR
jgi:hypothetical protein